MRALTFTASTELTTPATTTRAPVMGRNATPVITAL